MMCKHSSGLTWISACMHRPKSAWGPTVARSMGAPSLERMARPPLPRPSSSSHVEFPPKNGKFDSQEHETICNDLHALEPKEGKNEAVNKEDTEDKQRK
eukprot:139957-Amphidinium_carterae.7